MQDDALKPAAALAAQRKPGFPGENPDYARARQDLLAEEIEFRRHMTRLVAQRQALPPGPVIDKDYRFKDEGEYPALVVFRKDGDQVRLFWKSEMTGEMADPGQDPRDAPDIAALWSILDLTPGGRPDGWYPRLRY